MCRKCDNCVLCERKQDWEKNADDEVKVTMALILFGIIFGTAITGLSVFAIEEWRIIDLKLAHTKFVSAIVTVQQAHLKTINELNSQNNNLLQSTGILLTRIDVETNAKQRCINQLIEARQ